MSSIAIGSFTKIYPENPGGVITQAFPTQRRTFHSSALVRPQDAALWTEWTATERDAWLAVAHEVPHLDPTKRWLIDLWNKACGKWGRYNEETGYFELNGLTDITYDQALAIHLAGQVHGVTANLYRQNGVIRTTYPVKYTGCADLPDASGMFQDCANIESISFDGWYGGFSRFWFTFAGCKKLKTIENLRVGTSISSDIGNDTFRCPNLEELDMRFENTHKGLRVDLTQCPLITRDSFQRIAANSAAQSMSVTLTLHPEAYARLTDEILEQAAAKNITFAEA